MHTQVQLSGATEASRHWHCIAAVPVGGALGSLDSAARSVRFGFTNGIKVKRRESESRVRCYGCYREQDMIKLHPPLTWQTRCGKRILR
jgi:hypothetical protein